MTVSLTRKYRFSASHRLHTDSLTEEENARVFGKCNNPYGHGHDYELEVTVRGLVNEQTGILVPVSALDRLVEVQVVSRIANRNINIDVREFADLVPTTENLTTVIGHLLSEHWKQSGLGDASLVRIHIQETPRNSFELRVGGGAVR